MGVCMCVLGRVEGGGVGRMEGVFNPFAAAVKR